MEIKTRVKDFFTREKIAEGLRGQFKFSIQEIAFAGIIVGLWVISDKFITIDFGIMKAGIIYVWAILLGLTTKPVLGVVTAIIADTIKTAAWVGMGMWMWEYAIIYPLITLCASLFKHTFKLKNKYIWWSIMLTINAAAIVGAISFAIAKNDFYKGGTSEAAFDFTTTASKAIVWTCAGIMVAFFATLSILALKNEKFKVYLGIYSLVALTTIFAIWVWGPVAQIKYLIRLYGNQKDGSSYWNLYHLYLTARVLKTPVILPLYTAIIGATYFAYQQVEKFSSIKHRW